MRGLLTVLLVASIAGCATYQRVDTGEATVGRLRVQVESEWTSINPRFVALGGPSRVWTRDGTTLNYLLLYDGIENGATLFTPRDGAAQEYPPFRANMTEAEIAELVSDSMKRQSGANEVVLDRLAPATFAGHDGFTLELSFTAASELDYRTFAAGSIIDGELYLIVFTAPRLHFYDEDIGQVRNMVRTASVAPSS